jgi:phage anti-repressor protein
MESFIKQFSKVPHDFITDFFIIAKEEYSDNEIIIDFNIVAKWLNVNKNDIKKVLVKNFEENFDYTIEKKKKKQINSRGATIYELILITPNCFKELCMISQTSKAKEVRKYFIELEKLIKRYFEIIKAEMYKKIGILEINQKPKTKIKGGVIYILKALNSDITLYKLGKTKDLRNRLNTYNSGNANDVEPLFILPVNDIDSVESCVKKACKTHQYRKYKEVYEIDIDVLKDVMTECNDFVNKMAAKFNNKTEKKKFKTDISRMKKKLDKYFIYLSPNEIDQNDNDNVLDV